ncbi:MAG: IS21 family transposase [Deltaproteobacteria bacterium]|nr:IS21 family transposase [Deltaproteobacteria bacterium]
MVTGDLWHEIHARYKLKEPKKSIARGLGLDVRTVRRILRQKAPQEYRRAKRSANVLTPWADYIRQRLAAVGYCAQAILEELRERGYTGGYDAVKRFIRPLRKEAQIQATIRFETPPGRQGQADWGQCWTWIGGRRLQVHLFVLALGYSRRMFSVATRDEKLGTFIRCHTEAFDHFGGIPQEILYDNPKTIVLARDVEGRIIRWNNLFWDFCRYYGFSPHPHRPYRPQTKGKVESGIKYVKRFLRGKRFESLDHLNAALAAWIDTVADQRIHGTTHRKPADMFAEERDLLMDHRGKPPYTIQERTFRQVSKDCLVAFETNRYSVPFRYAGQPVEVQTLCDQIRIYHDDTLIAQHQRLDGSYRNQVNRDHYLGLFKRDRIPPWEVSSDEVQIRDLAFYEAVGGVR